MAMIRGRKMKVTEKKHFAGATPYKLMPLARLKEQRRLTIGYSSTPEQVLTAIDDPDPYYKDKKTFLVLNRDRLIYRFSEEKSLFLLGRSSRIRMAFIKILINKWFNGIVITTILLNCLVMMVNGNEKPQWSEKYVENVFTAIYTFEMIVKIVGRGFALHSFSYLRDPWNWIDFVVIVAAYVLILVNQLPSTGSSSLSSLTFLRAIRVLRVFKTVSVIPGLRMIVSALVASTKALKDVMLLSLMGFSMFSLVGIQVFRGTLRQKCVLLPPWMLPPPPNCSAGSNWTLSDDPFCSLPDYYGKEVSSNFGVAAHGEMVYLYDQLRSGPTTAPTASLNGVSTWPDGLSATTDASVPGTAVYTESQRWNVCDAYTNATSTNWTFARRDATPFNSSGYKFDWSRWLDDSRHYLKNGDVYRLCGNQSSAVKCPVTTTCVRAGGNPNFGFTSFDNFFYAFLSVFRLSLQDNWEELYLQVMETNGQLAFFFFIVIIFLGSYYLVNLILAVVASAYEGQRKDVANALEEEKRELLSEKEILKKRRNAARTMSELTRQSQKMQSKGNCFARCTCYESFKEIFLLWSCCIGESLICKVRDKLNAFFSTSVAEMITVMLVILNTFFMALDGQPMGETLARVLFVSNIVFTMLFAVEMVLKIFALSPYNYFIVSWNVFDFVVVTLSLMELVLSDKLPDGLSVLRTFRLIRLVRILKLARSWPTLSKLMQMIGDSLSKVGYLTLVLLIVLVIFALAGMQTVGPQFYMNRDQGLPLRWHMNDFPHAFLVVFRIQCGEWIQNMWRCMHSVKEEGAVGLFPVCLFIFLGVVVVGNLVVLNLFLALLLNSFSGDALKNGGGKKRSAKQFLTSIKHAGKKAFPKLQANSKRKVAPEHNKLIAEKPGSAKESTKSQKENESQTTDSTAVDGTKPTAAGRDSRKEGSTQLNHVNGVRTEEEEQVGGNKPKMEHPVLRRTDNGSNNNSTLKPNSAKVFTKETTTTCSRHGSEGCSMLDSKPTRSDAWSTLFGKFCNTKPSAFGKKWSSFRSTMNRVVQHNVFESFIIFVIFLSSAALVFDDIYLPEKPKLKQILMIFDRIFTAIFFIEMVMKWIGFGLKKYFTNGWCLLDFFIVLVSLVSLALEIVASHTGLNSADLSFLRVLRSLRAFRPLRAMSRFQGIKVVTDALFRSIPSILNVFVICLIFWLIFAIMGVNFFAGKMAACRWRESGEKVWHPLDFERWPDLLKFYEMPPINVTDKESCNCLAALTGNKVYWKNLEVNFDNVMIAYVSLLQVATFKGWMPIMYAAVDSPDKIDDQPIRDNNVAMYFFFVAFIIFGAFFTLNLFISVVIDNFNQQKKKFEFAGAELFLTDSQKKMYSAMKKLKAKFPRKLLPVPKSRWRERLYLFVTGDKFELAVMVITILNLVAMAVEHDNMTAESVNALQIVSYVFLAIFTVEILLRIIAMGLSYFMVPWNIFDFLIIFGSLLANIISLALQKNSDGDVPTVPTSPWLPMLRMIRIARILRIARVASGIRTLLFALMLSAPALFNVGSLLFLFMFIYAIFGMSQFSHVEKKGALNDVLNFETFPNTFLLLFQMSTSAGWDGFMEPTLYVDGPNAECQVGMDGDKGTCMTTTFIGYFYFVSYLLITFVIVTNMYIAIILENFDLATKDNEEALTADDFEHFFDMWQRYDKNGNGKLTVDQLSELLHNIDRPIQIRRPNKQHIATMRIPMCEDCELQILDVASALLKKILGSEGLSADMEEELKSYYQRKNIAPYDTDHVTDTFVYIEQQKANKASDGGFGVTSSVMRLAKLVRDNLVMPPVSRQPSPDNNRRSACDSREEKVDARECSVTRADVHRDPELVLNSGGDFSKRATLVLTSAADSATLLPKACARDTPRHTSDCNSMQTLPESGSTCLAGGPGKTNCPRTDDRSQRCVARPLAAKPKNKAVETAPASAKAISGDVVIHMPEDVECLKTAVS